jgi:hypothetical protein
MHVGSTGLDRDAICRCVVVVVAVRFAVRDGRGIFIGVSEWVGSRWHLNVRRSLLQIAN